MSLRQGQKKIKDQQMSSDRRSPQYPTNMLKVFRGIRAKFHPVMRHYFLEKALAPGSWFEMRLQYSRSVAVSSIVGHLVGLGDRHISNILIDEETGELVHIDLGIAFDQVSQPSNSQTQQSLTPTLQGQLLPIPERVPFRLTADIVDGLGMTGTEGVFRRCAEETLRVLREHSEIVETVLQVFKHDPLHSWYEIICSLIKITRLTKPMPFQDGQPVQTQTRSGRRKRSGFWYKFNRRKRLDCW